MLVLIALTPEFGEALRQDLLAALVFLRGFQIGCGVFRQAAVYIQINTQSRVPLGIEEIGQLYLRGPTG